MTSAIGLSMLAPRCMLRSGDQPCTSLGVSIVSVNGNSSVIARHCAKVNSSAYFHHLTWHSEKIQAGETLMKAHIKPLPNRMRADLHIRGARLANAVAVFGLKVRARPHKCIAELVLQAFEARAPGWNACMMTITQ